eukprot:1679608-Prorocentrum_lima.AAC.1
MRGLLHQAQQLADVAIPLAQDLIRLQILRRAELDDARGAVDPCPEIALFHHLRQGALGLRH